MGPLISLSMPTPIHYPHPELEQQSVAINDFLSKRQKVFFINFPGLQYKNFHLIELYAVSERKGVHLSLIEPYVAPLGFFTSTDCTD